MGQNTLPPDAAALLAKAAADPALVGRMQKSANMLMRGLGRLGRNIPGLNRAYTTPGAAVPGKFTNPAGRLRTYTSPEAIAAAKTAKGYSPVIGPRQFSGARLAALGGGGALAYGHANNDAQDTVGMSLNPLTWTRGAAGRYMGFSRGPSPEDIYQRNAAQFNTAGADIQRQMQEALHRNDMEGYNRLNEQYMRGDFGGPQAPGMDDDGNLTGNWNPFKSRMFGLNPFADRRGSYHQGQMQQQQQRLSGELAGIRGRHGPQPGDAALHAQLTERLKDQNMLAPHRQAIAAQLKALQKRMESPAGTKSPEEQAMIARMLAAGMHVPEAGPAAPAAPAAQGGTPNYWHLGGQARRPGRSTGSVLMGVDFRYQAPQPWDAVQTSAGPFGNG